MEMLTRKRLITGRREMTERNKRCSTHCLKVDVGVALLEPVAMGTANLKKIPRSTWFPQLMLREAMNVDAMVAFGLGKSGYGRSERGTLLWYPAGP